MSDRKMITEKFTERTPAPMKLLVKRDAARKETQGGIAIPESASSRRFFATVVSAGDGVPLKSGDRICYGGMYQMVVPDGMESEDGFMVLRWPEEVMYRFEEKEHMRLETDEEYEERTAKENRKLELLKGGKLVDQ